MAATMSAATSLVAPQATIASSSSVVFNNGALRVNMVASRRSARPSLAIRAAGEPGTGKDERVDTFFKIVMCPCMGVGGSFMED
jgi:hypothetical protein